MVIGGPPSFDRVRGLREVLTATGAGIYLAAHVAGPIPAEVMAAVHESDEMELRVGRVGPDRADDLDQREREARAVMAAVLKASPERLVLTHGAAEAARLVAIEVLERATVGRVVLVRGIDRAVAAAVRDVAEVAGMDVDVAENMPEILSADTQLVVLTEVDADGRLADVAAAAAAARSAGARSLVDLGRSAGARTTDVESLGADFAMAEAYRWLLGPDAMAALWITPELDPELPEWLRQASAPFGRGTLLALARSVGWLLMYVELPWAIERTGVLAEQLYEALGAIEGVELAAEPAAHGPIAAFRVAGWDAESVADELGRSIFAIVEADAEADLIRASVGAWNRESELERFVGRVAELAVHTPETLPRKPSLTVLSGPLDPEDVR
jgi:selenocysteine lyase/cysteine desulfurase